MQRAPTSQPTSVYPKVVRVHQTGENPKAARTQWTSEKLRAVETQRMGANLRAKVACFHRPVSVDTRRRTDNARTGNDEARSSLGNVFRRLSSGTNMRDTLNRRREQERSQHFIAQRRQQEVVSQGIKHISIERPPALHCRNRGAQ